MDAHALELDDDSFDLTGSQFGVMLVPDQPIARREMFRVTKPADETCSSRTAHRPSSKTFSSSSPRYKPSSRLRRIARRPSPLEFQVADSEVLRQRLTTAGLKNVTVDTTQEERVEFRSGEDMWNWLLGRNPIARTIVGDLPEDQHATVRQSARRDAP